MTTKTVLGLLKEGRKIIRASNARQNAKDWDVRATNALSVQPPCVQTDSIRKCVYAYQTLMLNVPGGAGTYWQTLVENALEECKHIELKFKEPTK